MRSIRCYALKRGERFLGGPRPAVMRAMGGGEILAARGLSGEEQTILERAGEQPPRRGVAGQGIAVCAADAAGSAPARGDERSKVPSSPAPEKRDDLPDGVVKACGRSALLDHFSAFAAEKAFDHRPAEWPDVIGGRARIARIAELVSLRRERALPDNFQEKLLVAAEGKNACRSRHASRPLGSLIASLARTAVDTVRIAARARRVPPGSRPQRLAARARFPRPAWQD